MNRTVTAFLACLVLLASSAPAHAGTVFPRLDPRLAYALVPGGDPVPVLVEFVDKGEQGPADLTARLAQAERDLTPENRSRRMRRGVSPLVDYLDLPLAPEYLRALEAQGLHPYGLSRWFNAVTVRTSGEQLARLASLDCVRSVSAAPLAAPRTRRPGPETDLVVSSPRQGTSLTQSNAVGYGMTGTEMTRLHVTALHDSGYTGAGVLVCVFDEGFNYYTKHTATRDIDVSGRTRDFVRGGTNVQDTVFTPSLYQHGQWTLSTIGGNAPGIFLGPAFGARYALARTEDSGSEKPIEMVNWLMASEWADSLGADLISSSLGYFTFPDSAGTSLTYAMLDGHTSIITRAVEIAAAKGILVVNSAGNSGPGANTLDAPSDACGDSMLAAGAVDSLGTIASFSSRGPTADGRIKPDVMAQGVSVLVASAAGPANTYGRLGGTSFSCPLTAGVAACLLQARPAWRLPQIVHALKYTASNAFSPNSNYGWGMINGQAALSFDTAGVPGGHVPLRFSLVGPNPVHLDGGFTTFSFGLAAGAPANVYTVRVYDVAGRAVRTLWTGWLDPNGVGQKVNWDGTDDSGRGAEAGLYFVSFESGRHHTSVRVAAIR